jgi:hypothetical protein
MHESWSSLIIDQLCPVRTVVRTSVNHSAPGYADIPFRESGGPTRRRSIGSTNTAGSGSDVRTYTLPTDCAA